MDLFGEEPVIEEAATEALLVEGPVEVFSHPRAMSFCLGHETVEQRLLEHFQSGRLPHGMVFSGPKGIGKATLAYRFAKFLLKQISEDPNQDALFATEEMQPVNFDIAADEQAARFVTSGAHPDLMTVERNYDAAKNTYKAGVEVAEIRKITPFLRMTSANGGWRVVIVDDADTMNRNAQNALLKILEEPPEKTVLILVTHRLGALIPTIRSRAQTIPFQPLSTEILTDLLERQACMYSPDDMDLLIHLSGGSFGKALAYIEQDGLQTLQDILKSFDSYPNWDWVSLHALADQLGRVGQNQAYQNFQELFILVFSELITIKARGQSIGNTTLNSEMFQALLRNSSLEQLLKICENLQDHFAKVEAANLDKRQAVLSAFSLITA